MSNSPRKKKQPAKRSKRPDSKPASSRKRSTTARPAGAKPPGAAKKSPAGERLQKVLAAAGVASRRECEQLIVEGRVEVDGNVVDELGSRVVAAKQEIRVDGEVLRLRSRKYFAVNKPRGVVSTARDPAGRPRVIDMLPPDAGRLFNVGRLDMESEGLILVTNDGELANRLTHPKHGVEKVYHVQVAGKVEADVLAQMRKGVQLSEAFVRPVDVRVKSHVKKSTVLEMTLDEGRNREIRRLLARVGHKVQRLTRVAVGPIRLGDLPLGGVRLLNRDEVRKLEDAASGVVPKKRRPPRKGTLAAKKPQKKTAGGTSTGTRRAVIGGESSGSAPKKAGPARKTAKSAGKPLRGPAGKKSAKAGGKPTGKPRKKGKR